MAVAFINPSLDPRITVYRSYMYVCRELSKRVLPETFQVDSASSKFPELWAVVSFENLVGRQILLSF